MTPPDLAVTDEAARARLSRAAAYLDALPPSRFTMERFAAPDAHGRTPLPAGVLAAGCGTVGCLAGHIPHIDPEWTRAYIDARCRRGTVQIEFPELANAFIGRPPRDGAGPIGHYGADPLYCWLFNGLWHEVDDTPAGAAERIRIALDDGVPGEFARMRHLDPATYAEKSPDAYCARQGARP